MIKLENLLRLSNYLTLSRVVMTPIFMSLFSAGLLFYSLLVFVIASLTDLLDGQVARKEGTTGFGKFMDPLADKLIVSAALISLARAEMGLIAGWMVLVIIGREFTVTGLRMIAAANGCDIASTKWGKLKTSSQMITISLSLFLLVLYDLKIFELSLINKARDPHGPIYFLMYIPLTFTVISGLEFLFNNRRLFKELLTSQETGKYDDLN